jgi:hypothetical protein
MDISVSLWVSEFPSTHYKLLHRKAVHLVSQKYLKSAMHRRNLYTCRRALSAHDLVSGRMSRTGLFDVIFGVLITLDPENPSI